METEKLDIVYTLKSGDSGNEIKYSLRSLKNFPHQKVFIYGGCPKWVRNVQHISVDQDKGNKWANTAKLLMSICNNDNISEDFVWFNDDFFVLKPIERLEYFYDRNLRARVNDFKIILGWNNGNRYTNRLLGASRTLTFAGKNNLNYELHIPIIFNRKKLKMLIERYPTIGAKRSLYGNFFVDNSIERDDVKIYDMRNVPDETWDFVSTSDQSFKEGQVGKWIRKKFNRKCEYEKSS